LYCPQDLGPVLVGEEDLGCVPGHDGEIGGGGRRRGGGAMDPGDGGTSVLGPRDVERGRGWVDRHHGAAGAGQQEGQAARTAADVEHAARVQFLRDGQVGGQVIARAIEGVVDRSQARVGENRVGHTATVSAQPRHQLEADLVHRSLARTCTGYVEYEMWRSRE
jgi:hypothetical protein